MGKTRIYDTGVFNDYTDETHDRYSVKAKNKTQAISITKKRFGSSSFKKDKHLKVDVAPRNIFE